MRRNPENVAPNRSPIKIVEYINNEAAFFGLCDYIIVNVILKISKSTLSIGSFASYLRYETAKWVKWLLPYARAALHFLKDHAIFYVHWKYLVLDQQHLITTH